MSIKKYVIRCAAALAIGFGAGLYIGTAYNADIKCALCKTQKKAYEFDRDLRIWTPRVVEKAVRQDKSYWRWWRRRQLS